MAFSNGTSTREIMESYSSNILQNGSDSDTINEPRIDASNFVCSINDDRQIGENIIINNLKTSFQTSTPILIPLDDKDSNIHGNSTFDALSNSRSSQSVISSDRNSVNSVKTSYETTKNLLSSFLNNDDDIDISDDNRKLFIFILEKIDFFENQTSKEKEINIKLNKKVADLENNNKYLTENLQLLLKNKNANTQEKFNNLDEQIKKIVNLNKQLNVKLSGIDDSLYTCQRNIINIDQYSRRENLVISGIPDSIHQNDLENKVIDIIRSIGFVNLSSYEIVACHRLYKRKNDKYPARTIVRFTNRKVVNFCLDNRDRLLSCKDDLGMNLRFFENLSEENEYVYKECHQLQSYGLIHKYFIRNGFVKIVVHIGDKPIKIYHPDDLYFMFADYYKYGND